MKPPKSGPMEGPTKGDAVYINIGSCNCSRLNMSPTVPPATERNALPEIPSKNLAMSIVWIFLATAEGMIQMKNMLKEHRYTGLLP